MNQRKHVHHQAHQHHQAHLNLKSKVGRHQKKKENFAPVFIGTFVIAFISLFLVKSIIQSEGVFKKSSKIKNSPKATIQEELIANGLKKGMISNYRISRQSDHENQKLIQSIGGMGGFSAALANLKIGEEKEVTINQQGWSDSIWLTNYLSTGRHLTTFQKKQSQMLRKSLISTYYLGEKTIDNQSILQNDTRLISQIRNALSVDLFQYLDQAINRSDALDSYLHLLGQLQKKTEERLQDLNSKIAFISSNSVNQNQKINISEEAFFDHLNRLDGPNAEKELGEFIQLQEGQAEIRAKLGAYQSLAKYYEFFQPRIESLINEIKLNRDALIAGVKVVEIQNMSLPLIIKSR